eukprot:364227-Chlamydomonas_euryale.AAC.2
MPAVGTLTCMRSTGALCALRPSRASPACARPGGELACLFSPRLHVPHPAAPRLHVQGSYSVLTQAELCKSVALDMGFSLDNGRLDVSVHPFTGGAHPTDVRMTTRFKVRLAGHENPETSNLKKRGVACMRAACYT